MRARSSSTTMGDMSHVDTDSADRSAPAIPREIRIGARRIRSIPVAIALLGVIGVFMIASYDGRSKTERVSDCLTARGYVLQVIHDDGKEPIGGDEGLLGPLGDYQARPPSDTISVGVAVRACPPRLRPRRISGMPDPFYSETAAGPTARTTRRWVSESGSRSAG